MKKLITAFLLASTGLPAFAAVTCSQGSYRVDVAAEKAVYFYGGEQIAAVENVQLSEVNGIRTYSSDMGFALNVKGSVGQFTGLWPSPAALFDSSAPLVLKCSGN